MRVLFVCTGNTCRSALAEAIATRMAADRGRPDVQASSAGTLLCVLSGWRCLRINWLIVGIEFRFP